MTFCVLAPAQSGTLLQKNFKKAGFDASKLISLINSNDKLKSDLACVRVAGQDTPIDLRALPIDGFRFSLSKSRIFLHIGEDRFLVKTLIYKNGINTEIEPSGLYIHQGHRPPPILAAPATNTLLLPQSKPIKEPAPIESEAPIIDALKTDRDNEPPVCAIDLEAEFDEALNEEPVASGGRKKEINPLFLRIVEELDENALAEYFVNEERSLKFFAYKFVRDEADAEDMVQTAFLKALRSLQGKKDGTSDSLCHEPAYFGTWVHQIIKNNAFNLAKQKTHTSQEHFDTVNEYPDEGFGQGSIVAESSLDSLAPDEFQDPLHYLMQLEEQASSKERIRNIADAAADGNDRLTMLLASSMKLSGLEEGEIFGVPPAASYDDLAAQFDIPVGTVRSRIHRARELVEKLAPR